MCKTKNDMFGMDCPICQDGYMGYTAEPNPQAHGTDAEGNKVTHIWVCDTCPAVLLEWYTHDDSKKLHETLK